MQQFKLSENSNIPALGFGTWHLSGSEAVEAVSTALKVGYRHIDTADRYENHVEVGQAIKQSGLKRGDIFLTTKVWWDELRTKDLKAAAERFLHELQTDYLDLLLIHWPNPSVPINESLQAMKELKEKGIIREIGVSNFTEKLLDEALQTGIQPVANQVELHPTFNQEELKKYCDEKDILLIAYSPLGSGRDINHIVITTLAKKYNKTPAQIILNWIIGRGVAAIPKSSNKNRIKENFESLDFKLNREDAALITNTVKPQARFLNPSFAKF